MSIINFKNEDIITASNGGANTEPGWGPIIKGGNSLNY